MCTIFCDARTPRLYPCVTIHNVNTRTCTLFKDILQLMIEASDDKRTNREAVLMRECPKHRPRGHKLSAKEILDNSLTLLFDETSKNTLAHISYLLAINPEIQMKLQSEIDDFFEENPVRLYILLYIQAFSNLFTYN